MKAFKKFLAGLLAMTTVFSVGAMAACDDDEGGESVPVSESQVEKGSEVESGGNEGDEKEENDFIGALGGVSETYVSEVSKESYATADEAAAKYVQEQVVGETLVSILNVSTKKELNEAEISALKISEEDSKDIVGVEEMEVEYSGLFARARSSSETRKVTVYVIKYPNHFKYYTPCPVTGETINKAYYDSVFNGEKYKNCTLNSSMKMVIEGEEAGQTAVISTENIQTIKYAKNVMYIEQTIKSYSMMAGEEEQEDVTMCVYIEQVGEEIYCLAKMVDNLDAAGNMDWTEADFANMGFGSLEELSPFYDEYLDYTYFTKTDFGFELSDENAQQYINETVQGQISSLGEGKIEMYAKYYVADGVLSGMRMNLDLYLDIAEGGTGSAEMSTIIKVTDYGTTTIEKPVVAK